MTHRHVPTVDQAIKEYDAAERGLEEASAAALRHKAREELHRAEGDRLDEQTRAARRRLDIALATLIAAARARR